MIADKPSPNHEPRRGTDAPDMVVLHYTGMVSAKAATDWLCTPRSGVSAHYLVDEDGTIVRMVPEERRAWHAGVAFWQGARDINSRSIGVEIHNPGHDFDYPPFPAAQIDAVIALIDGIRTRWTIADARILAHSDVAPARKVDPGERFPWPRLAAAGHGIWPGTEPAGEGPVSEGTIATILAALDEPADGVEVALGGFGADRWQASLARFGYEVTPSGTFDTATRRATSAFQRHFAPHRLDGVPDAPTRAALQRLEERAD